MSLNRYEQAFFAYLQDHPDEGRHWQSKVAARALRGAGQAPGLADELWEYSRERSGHAEPFREWAQRGGVPRSSLLNLAEYLLRVWSPPLPGGGRGAVPKPGGAGSGQPEALPDRRP